MFQTALPTLDSKTYEDRTLGVYDSRAAALVAQYEAGDRCRLQTAMASPFAEGSTVLELGCGSGADAAFLHARGIEIIPTDGSDAMLKEAARCHPELQEKLRKIVLPQTLPFKEGQLDGVVVSAVLMHLTPESVLQSCKEIARVLKDGGAIFLAVISGRTDLNSEGFDGQGRYFNQMSLEQIERIFAPLGIKLVDGHVVPDALRRTNVTIEEGVFKKL
jgi:ubiquinone/menaquinone biosynthesis C-methylase UbiE